MAQVIVAILLLGAFVLAIKVALLMIFLVGLIWRPKETIALIVVLGAFALVNNYPRPVAVVVGLLALVGIVRLLRRKGEPATLELPDDSGT